MHRPAAQFRSAAVDRLAVLEREIPEWTSWTAMLRVVAQAIGDPVWRDPIVGPVHSGETRPGLHGQRIRVPQEAMHALLRTLLEIVPRGSGAMTPAQHAGRIVALVPAAMTGDAGAIRDAAGTLGMDNSVLATVLNAATIPLLNACSAQLELRLADHWPHAYCPVCGARPVLAELLGLDRARRLRCGRCGAGWNVPWLACAFCREADHARLGTLVAERGEPACRVATCGTCRGYLKTLTALTAGSHVDVLLADLETVAFDIAAQNEGYVGPEGPGCPVTLTCVAVGAV